MPSPRQFTLFLLFVIMEMLAGFTVVVGTSLLDATTVGYAIFWVLLIVALVGLLAGLAATALPLGRRIRGGLVLGLGILTAGLGAVLVANNGVAGIVTAGMLGIAYWRGLRVGADSPDFDDVQNRFGYGFVAIFFGIVWVLARGILGRHEVWYMLAIAGIAYIVTSLLALALARLAGIRERGAGGAVALAIGIQLLLVAILAFGALQIFSLDLVGGFMHLTRGLWDAVGSALYRTAMLLADPIQRLFDWIKPRAHRPRAPQLQNPVATTGSGKRPKPKRPESSPLVTGIALAVVAALLSGLGYLVWKVVPRGPSRVRARGFTETRASLMTPGEMVFAILRWLRGLLRRSVVAASEAGTAVRKRITGPEYPADPVRRLYSQMLYRAQLAGFPRPGAVTPAEYGTALAARWPAAAPDIATLTTAYVSRRYGDEPIPEGVLQSVRQSARTVRLAMRTAPATGATTATPDREVADPDRFTLGWLGRTLGISAVGAIIPLLVLVLVLGALLGVASLLGQHPAAPSVTPTVAHSVLVASDSHGRLYVLYSDTGRLVAASPALVPPSVPLQSSLHHPQGFAIGRQNRIYIADTGVAAVDVFSPAGMRLAQWGETRYRLSRPWGIVVGATGTVFVADSGHSRVLELSADGAVLHTIGSHGAAPGQLSTPYGLALDRSGNLYVADGGNHRVDVFDAEGRFLADWPVADPAATRTDPPGPMSVAIDGSGHVYVAVAETAAARYTVQEFTPSGRLLKLFGTAAAPPHLSGPVSVAADRMGRIWLAEWRTGSVSNLTGSSGQVGVTAPSTNGR